MLLREMQIQNPTAVMIARAAVAQDDVTGWVAGAETLVASRKLSPKHESMRVLASTSRCMLRQCCITRLMPRVLDMHAPP